MLRECLYMSMILSVSLSFSGQNIGIPLGLCGERWGGICAEVLNLISLSSCNRESLGHGAEALAITRNGITPFSPLLKFLCLMLMYHCGAISLHYLP